jgi:hypothetical protein
MKVCSQTFLASKTYLQPHAGRHHTILEVQMLTAACRAPCQLHSKDAVTIGCSKASIILDKFYCWCVRMQLSNTHFLALVHNYSFCPAYSSAQVILR